MPEDVQWLSADALDWLAEAYGAQGAVRVVSVNDEGAEVQVGRRILWLLPQATGIEVQESGQVGRGRPQVVPPTKVRRQFKQCRAQLEVLRRRLSAMGRRSPTVEDANVLAELLQDIGREVVSETQGPITFWLRTLKLATVRDDAIEMAENRKVAEEPDREPVLGPDDVNCVVLSALVPIERWQALMTGGFSPSNLALRILSVHYGLRFDFLDEDFEDHDLFIRKLVYGSREGSKQRQDRRDRNIVP